MNTKLALIAASVIAISAHANANAQEVEPVAEDKGVLETLFSDEQPPLEGDSPLTDDDAVTTQTDDALVGEGYADDDEVMIAEPGATRDTLPLGVTDGETDIDQEDPTFADTDPTVDAATTGEPLIAEGDPVQDAETMDDAETEFAAPATTGDDVMLEEPAQDLADTDQDVTDPMRDAEPMMADGAADTEMDAETELADSEPLPARDAKIAAVPTDPTEAVAEAALIAGTYEVTIPNRPGTSTLFVEGRGTEAAGTFDGEPIDVIVTGRNFSFDAPVTMDGEEQLMTFAGTVEEGVIDNGVIEAQGDGGYLTFDARRVDAASMDEGSSDLGTDAMSDDVDSGDVSMGDMEADAFGSDTETMMETTDEAETGFGVTGSDVLDDAGDEAGFGETYDDEAAGFGTEDADIDTMDADTDVMGGSDVMDTDSASDALTTDGGLERDADDLGTDSMMSDEPMTDQPMMDEPVTDDADAEFGTDSDVDAATEGDVMEDDQDDAGDPNFEF